MGDDLGQYRWSSYQHKGLGQGDALIPGHVLYLALGLDTEVRLAAYCALFRSEQDDAATADIRVAISQGQPLGNNRFTKAVCTAAGVRRTPARRGRPEGSASATQAPDDHAEFGFRRGA